MDRVKETFLQVVQVTDGKEVPLWSTGISALEPTLTSVEGGSYKLVLSPLGTTATATASEDPDFAVSVEYFEGDDGWYYHVVGYNGQILNVSEAYTRKDSARKAAVRTAKQLGVGAVEV